MAVTFTRGDQDRKNHAVGDLWLLEGTLTFSGSYATGGDSLDVQKLVKESGGFGQVLAVLGGIRGHQGEYDNTNKKLKLYASANTEHAAAAYNAALTGSVVPVVFLCR